MQKAVIVEFVKESLPVQECANHPIGYDPSTSAPGHFTTLKEIKCDPFDPRCSCLHNLKKITFHF